ncbi:MAG TPA: hypothetical protein VGC08_11790 [Pedobacter sp.]
MDKKKLFILIFIGFTGLSYTRVCAQNSDPDIDTNMWMQQPVVVDGNSSEWHEPLNNFNTPTQLAFAIANDQQNLYLIIESLDEITTGKLLRGGLTLNINTAGKKKDGIKLNFLGMQQPPSPHHDQADTLDHTEADMNHSEHGPGVSVIQVSGFKNIPDGSLAIPNDAGIQIAAAFNKQKDYICELAIPLAQLNLKGDELKAIAYNIKINAPGKFSHEGKRPNQALTSAGGSHGGGMGGGGGMRGGGGGMGGMGGGGGRHGGGMHGGGGGMGGDSAGGTAKASDFWVKYELAKPADSFRAN